MQNVDAAGLGIGDDYPPRIMGVLNVSAESPYDPSVFADPGEAAAYVDRELIDEGADIVDVGLESANKRFGVLSAEEELDRLDVAVEAVESVSGDAVFSIETRYHEVAEAALDRGFDMVNDICGFADPEMPRVCRERDAAVVKMASPPDLERPGAVEETDWETRRSPEWAGRADYVDEVYEALKQNGLTDRTLVDPAFGGWSEAQTLEDDREAFRRLREFRGLDRPLLVSINRKNFLKDVAGRGTDAALPASLGATAMAVERGTHVVRTHDVAETRDAALIGRAFARDRLRHGDGVADERSESAGSRDATRPENVAVEELDVTTPTEAARHVERVGGDPAAAGEGVVRTLELRGLDAEEGGALRAAAVEVGARAVRGTDDERALLLGTPAALARIRERAAGVSTALDGALERVRRRFK